MFLNQGGDQENGTSVAGDGSTPDMSDGPYIADASPSDLSEDPNVADISPFDWFSFLSSEKGGRFLEDLLFLYQGGDEGSGASVAGDAFPHGGSEDTNAAATSQFCWSALLSGEESGKFFGDLLFLNKDGDDGSAIWGAEDAASSDGPDGPDAADASSSGGSGSASHKGVSSSETCYS